MARFFALGSALMFLAATVVAIYAVVLRIRGREVRPGVVRLLAALVGGATSFGFLFFEEPISLAIVMFLPAITAYYLLRRGKLVATGLLLAVLGLPGALWWGYFLVEDLLDPGSLYEPILWLWWAPEVVLIVVGAVLIARGDRDAPAPPLIPRAPAHVRDPGAIAHAIQRSIMIGPIPLPLILGLGLGFIAVGFGLPLAVDAGLPWPIGLLAGAVAFAVLIAELWVVGLPRGVRRAWEGYAVVGNPAMKRWIAETGTQVPTTAPAMQRWLRRNPDRPETRWARTELLIITGDLDAARATAESMPIDTDRDRFDQQSLLVYLDWVAGGDPDLDALRREAETVGAAGSAERRVARGEARVAVARELAASGGDWMAPLIEIRDEAGPIGGRLLREDIRRASYPKLLAMGLVVTGFVLLVSGYVLP